MLFMARFVFPSVGKFSDGLRIAIIGEGTLCLAELMPGFTIFYTA